MIAGLFAPPTSHLAIHKRENRSAEQRRRFPKKQRAEMYLVDTVTVACSSYRMQLSGRTKMREMLVALK